MQQNEDSNASANNQSTPDVDDEVCNEDKSYSKSTRIDLVLPGFHKNIIRLNRYVVFFDRFDHSFLLGGTA